MAARPLRDPCTTDITLDYTADELAFLAAVDEYCRTNRRRFLTACEYLALARSIGYRRVAAPGELPKFDRASPGRQKKYDE